MFYSSRVVRLIWVDSGGCSSQTQGGTFPEQYNGCEPSIAWQSWDRR